MTSRLRPVTRPRRRPFGGYGEDRQQFLVTALFVGAIALIVVILVAAFGLRYYDDNLRPLARVAGIEIRPELSRHRAALLQERISREEGRVRAAQISGEIDGATMSQRLQELTSESNEVPTQATEGLIDLIYQSQLAAERGITVTDADVDVRQADEFSSVDRRRVQAIFVEPQAADAATGPTMGERRAALDRARQALAAIESGRPWADVAAEFSTDPSRDAGGELGLLSQAVVTDEAWAEALFALPETGTTPIIAGADGIYRIGRVTEILPRTEEPHFRSQILAEMPLERYREFLRYEIAVDRLREQVVAEAVSGTKEQVNLAHIFVEQTAPTGDEEAPQGEVHYSEILFAPGDDVITAPDLPQDDPLWTQAQAEADAVFAELSGITDNEQLEERFAAIATERSDSELTAADGGDAGFNTRGLLPDKVAEALFDTERQPGELIGPVRADAGVYILLFHERRGSPEQRLQEVKDAVAQPNADFAALARQYSDAEDAEQGGELGWFTREMLSPEIVDEVFALEAGQVSEPLLLGEGEGEGHHFFKALEKAQRELDPDQVSLLRGSAFAQWYDPLKQQALDQGVIVRDASLEGEDLEPGLDQGEDVFDESVDEIPPVDE